MSLETNISLALARLDTPNIFRYTLLYATLIYRKSGFLILCPEIRTVEYRAETPT